jgi:hypothetical protein
MLLSASITTGIYIFKGGAILDATTLIALYDIWVFYSFVAWNFTLLIALYRSVKYLFNDCLGGYAFQLLDCNKKNIIEVVGYGDLHKITRKWIMSLVWLVSAFMIFALMVTKLFFAYDTLFEWFNIYWLYFFIVLSAYISFIIFPTIVKRVKISRC